MRQAWNLYARVMRDHPVKTQLITTATVMLSGDLIAQKVLERRFFIMGIAFVGPALRVWYLTLERIVGSGGGRAMVVKKVFLDQAVFTPVFLTELSGDSRFVPLSYRVPFASCVALVWNTYLAWKANRTHTA
ncbi:hypothetical protein MTO96_005979 [Rhipicephalus appendiculatus]